MDLFVKTLLQEELPHQSQGNLVQPPLHEMEMYISYVSNLRSELFMAFIAL